VSTWSHVLDLGVGLLAAVLAYLAYEMTGGIGWSVAIIVAATVVFVVAVRRRMVREEAARDESS
jgi:hypothetical protein